VDNFKSVEFQAMAAMAIVIVSDLQRKPIQQHVLLADCNTAVFLVNSQSPC